MLASLGTPMNNAVFQMQEAKDIPNLFPLSSARSMTDPLHRLKFGALSSYYDQIRSGVKWAVEDQGKEGKVAGWKGGGEGVSRLMQFLFPVTTRQRLLKR